MSLSNTDTDWMRRALAIAREADATPGKNPIGCVIVLNGRIIGEACNEVDLRHDATAHAEILAMGHRTIWFPAGSFPARPQADVLRERKYPHPAENHRYGEALLVCEGAQRPFIDNPTN